MTQLRIHRRPVDETASKNLEAEGLSPLMARLLASRGVKTLSDWHGTSLAELLPLSAMKNCEKAGVLLADAVQNGTRLCVLSDYDCDGATSCAIMLTALQAVGGQATFCVPDRLKHGYGLTPAIAEIAADLEFKPQVLVTVDNGISSIEGIRRAKELGMEVIVTDHHLAPEVLPRALCIVNPNQPGCKFESKSIAGCGVAFYVMAAMVKELRKRDWPQAKAFKLDTLLPFVAIGTVADVVNLDHNNRTLVFLGLELIRSGECSPGIKALAEAAKRELAKITTSDFGFQIGPRINAAGRLDDMTLGIECLTTQDPVRAKTLATELTALNVRRKELQGKALDDAVALLADRVNPDNFGAVVFAPDWHEGVVGIVAGRIKETVHKPTIVLTEAEDGSIKGSARSVPGFHLKHALDEVARRRPGLLVKYGGHAMAAGMTLSNLGEFQEVFEQVLRDTMPEECRTQVILTDGALPLGSLDHELVQDLAMGVWGQGFLPPVFDQFFALEDKRAMGQDSQHTRFVVKEAFGSRRGFKAAAFNMTPDDFDAANAHLVWKPAFNEWQGTTTIQILVERSIVLESEEAFA